MDRDEVTAAIVSSRLAKGLTWQELADAVSKPVVWTTAALLGQHPFALLTPSPRTAAAA